MKKCKICGKEFKSITNTHLSKHNITLREYIDIYGFDSVNYKNTFKKNSIPWNKGGKKLQKSWNKGKKLSRKHINRIIDNHFTNNMTDEEKTEYFRKIGRVGLHSQQKYHDTDIEQKFENILISNDVSYDKKPNMFGLPDFKVNNDLYFIDGCFWHGCKECYPSMNTIVKGLPVWKIRKKDKWVTNKLTKLGYNVIRIWEHEINNDKRLGYIIHEYGLSNSNEE